VLTEQVHAAELYAAPEIEGEYERCFRLANEIAQRVVSELVQGLTPQQALRVLEVGAGLGSTTGRLLRVLPPERTEYWFTDISRYFLDRAGSSFAGYPFLRFELLDLERDPLAQGFAAHSFDLIVASSVLHATQMLRPTLDRLRSLLGPGGILLMIEETRFHRFFDLSMGLMQGFDSFRDYDLRPENPLMSSAQWHALLREQGFESSATLTPPDTGSAHLGLDVIVARGPSQVALFRPGRLRDRVASVLPSYSVPRSYVALSEMPQTATGKLDRRALRAVGRPQERASADAIAPRTPTEHRLAAIWSRLLAKASIGIQDNFFELGGDSLHATQLVVQAKKEFQIEMPLRAVFENNSLAKLAEFIDVVQWANQDPPQHEAQAVV
jgi:acyl carrier protein/SAM-dependent methyltransferase